MVGGKIMLDNVGELDATFVFDSHRYESGHYEETLKIMTDKENLVAEALYMDDGDSILSTVEFADYGVHTSNGELRSTKGNYIRIYFDNKTKCKPRALVLVKGYGAKSKIGKKK